MNPKKCKCGKQTLSFYDVLSHKGLIGIIPCCPRCFNAIRRGLETTKAGDYVQGGHLVRYHNREYKPMDQIRWLFWLAEH